MNKPTTLTPGEAEDELQHVFGVCNCPEGDRSCFYQREYTRIEKENPDLTDVYVDAKVQVAAYRYIKEHYADRRLLAEKMRELKTPLAVPAWNDAIDLCISRLTNTTTTEDCPYGCKGAGVHHHDEEPKMDGPTTTTGGES